MMDVPIDFQGRYARIVRVGTRFNQRTHCWEWQRATNQNGVPMGAYGPVNRTSWLAYKGPIPDRAQVRRSCDTRGCVNPNHLYIGYVEERRNKR